MISFEPIDRSSDALLRNLYEHYVHDMSEWLGIQTRADGRFDYDTAPLWSGNFAVYLARSDGNLAGFAVAGSAEKWLGRSDARDVKDCFILRAHRHRRIADAMATHMWEQRRAEWLVRVLTANQPALAFWRRAVRNFVGDRFGEKCVIDNGREWIHFTFDARPKI